jgi:hypothetical protein
MLLYVNKKQQRYGAKKNLDFPVIIVNLLVMDRFGRSMLWKYNYLDDERRSPLG